MRVHACMFGRKGGEASLQERATQPGSLGLGAGSGTPTLSLSHADYGTRHCARERKAKGASKDCWPGLERAVFLSRVRETLTKNILLN